MPDIPLNPQWLQYGSFALVSFLVYYGVKYIREINVNHSATIKDLTDKQQSAIKTLTDNHQAVVKSLIDSHEAQMAGEADRCDKRFTEIMQKFSK